MLTAPLAARASIEPLEGRIFLAASVEKFNLMSLLGYDRLGASYKYRTTLTVAENDLIDSGTTTSSSKLTVGTKRQQFDGRASNVVKQRAVDTDLTVTSAWYQDSTGTYSTARVQSAEGVTISVDLHDSRIAPKVMYVGKKYNDTGTFDGTFSADLDGNTVTGTFEGDGSFSGKLFGRESITVRGKTYNAVKGVYAIALNGSLEVTFQGQSETVTAKVTLTETFWAAPGIGLVRASDAVGLSLSMPGEAPVKVELSLKSDLVSYVLP